MYRLGYFKGYKCKTHIVQGRAGVHYCRAYEERVREVERGSFTPLVFSSSGGMGRSATVTYRRLASLLSDKWNSPYPVIMGWLRCSLSFSLLRSALMCVRGSRSRAGSPGVPVAVDLAVAEGHLATNDV